MCEWRLENLQRDLKAVLPRVPCSDFLPSRGKPCPLYVEGRNWHLITIATWITGTQSCLLQSTNAFVCFIPRIRESCRTYSWDFLACCRENRESLMLVFLNWSFIHFLVVVYEATGLKQCYLSHNMPVPSSHWCTSSQGRKLAFIHNRQPVNDS